MPKFSGFAERTKQISGSVFEKFRPKMEARGSDIVGLHIGDSYAAPPYELPVDKAFLESHPGFNRYCDTFGIRPLREALAAKAREDNGLEVNPGNVMTTAGACNALSVGMQALVDPGEDVLLLGPYWPFFRGMVRLAGGREVEVPFYTRLYEEPDLDVTALLENHLTAETVAIYVNTPNNPSGKVLSLSQLEGVAEFARRHELWVISDEAYDGMTFDGLEHHSIARLPGMFARTLSVFTFSKVYMFSGLRLGYVVASEGVLENINKVMVHQLYGPSTISQQMMVEPVKSRARWARKYVEHFQELRDMFVENLRISARVPEGTYYLFFPVEEYLDGRDYWELIDQCLDAGVSVAPGEDFGADYSRYLRICFAGEPPDRLKVAVERLNSIFSG